MIQTRFPGLVIGGPLDGQLHEGRAPSFEIAENLPFGAMPAAQVLHAGPQVRIWRYHYLPTVAGIHFWVAEGETPESVLTKLAVAYIKVRTLDV